MFQRCESCDGSGRSADDRRCTYCAGTGEAYYVEVACAWCDKKFWRLEQAERARRCAGHTGPFCGDGCSNAARRAAYRENDGHAPVVRNDPDEARRYLAIARHPDGERLAMEVARALHKNRESYFKHGGRRRACVPEEVLRGHELSALQEMYILRAGILLSGTV